MTTDMAKGNGNVGSKIEQVLIDGDLATLSPEQRVSYYNQVCESLGLNKLTRPFQYLRLNGKTILYASKDCTEQLRKLQRVSITIVAREEVAGCYVVTARASNHEQRQDESTGAVAIEGLKGEARANALMKAETKAKRRVTLSICGLGILDESEVESVPGAVRLDAQVVEAKPVAKEVAPVPEAKAEPVAVDVGEAPDAELKMAVVNAVRSLKLSKAAAASFFTRHFGHQFDSLSKQQAEAAVQLLGAQLASQEAYHEAYTALKKQGRVL